MTVTVQEFKDWLHRGRAGSMCIYHTGYLALDRFHIVDVAFPGDTKVSLTTPIERVDEVARLALDAFEEKRVHLFQRKLHDNEYQYIAMKASRRVW